MTQHQIRILHFDIETAPCMAWIWGLWQEVRSTKMIEKDWYVLCWSALWDHEPNNKIKHSSLPEFDTYANNPENDRECCLKLWRLLDEADIVVAHNGKKFDVRKVNARFLIHGILPPSPYKIVDTLLVARRHFMFTSNKLDDLCQMLSLGGKKHNEDGFELWRRCMNGDSTAWGKMVKYCDNDVIILKKLYHRLLPYITNHPNVANIIDDDKPRCPKCGSDQLTKQGTRDGGVATCGSNVAKYQQYRCKECGGWCRGRANLKDKTVRRVLPVNIPS